MNLSHRGRITLTSAATAGVLFAVVFAGIVIRTRSADLHAREEILEPALAQAKVEVHEAPDKPDLSEIAGPDPSLTLAVFDANGNRGAHVGPMDVASIPGDGEQVLNGSDAMVLKGSQGGFTIVAALPLVGESAALQRLAILLALLWAPLTACVAAATWLSSRQTFAPLDSMAKRAAAMGGQDLAERLPVPADQEYGEFARQLNGLLDRLADSVQRQEQFVADAAHELRTPLTILLGNADAALQRERPPGEYRDALERIQSETVRLSALVEMLLLSASPQSEGSQVIDLSKSVEQAHARWVDRFSEKGVTLRHLASEARASVSEREIEIVLDNLLSNALRESPPDSECTLESQTCPDGARLSVQDQGKGVPDEIAARVFDRFVRGDSSRNRAAGGFGIGLAVCQRLIQAHGGRIELDPNYRTGARFVITFPLP